MSWIVLFASCFVSEGFIAQQASDPKEYVFFNDGAGEISTIPPNELCHQLVAATFRPDPDLFLEPLKDSQFSVLQNTPNIKVLQILCSTDPLTEQTAKII